MFIRELQLGVVVKICSSQLIVFYDLVKGLDSIFFLYFIEVVVFFVCKVLDMEGQFV